MDATEFRNVGHQVVDLLADYLASVDQQQITPDINPETVRALFDAPLDRSQYRTCRTTIWIGQ